MALPVMTELGVTGLKKSGGIVQEEFLRELQGHRWWKVVREMQQDAVIGGVLLAIELSLRQVKVEVEPANDTPAAAEVAEFVEQCLADMSTSWADTLSEILTMLGYGYSYLETCYKRRAGENKDAGKSSKYTDGRVGWRKWAIRSQDSLDRWEFDDDGGLVGFWQVQDFGPPVLVPIDKALLFRTKSHKGNPEGVSVLRSSYTAYYYKKNLSRVEAIGLERGLGGMPIAYIPPEYMAPDATAAQKAFFATIKEIVINVRRDEQEGIVFPLMYDENGNKMFEFSLLTTENTGGVNTDTAISRYNQQMTMSMLADFIMLGHEKVGSYALSATKSSLFKTALEAWLMSIADVINTHGIPRLGRYNGIPTELLPHVEFGKVGEVDLADLVLWIKEVSSAGGQLFPHLETENHLRNIVGLPMLDEDEFAEREAAAQADKEADRAAKAKQPALPNGQQGKGDDDMDEEMSAAEIRSHLQAADRVLARGA